MAAGRVRTSTMKAVRGPHLADFYRAELCQSSMSRQAHAACAACLSAVRPSVRHTLVSTEDYRQYDHAVFKP